MKNRVMLLALLLGLTAGCAADAGRLPRVNLITGGTGSDWDRIGSAIASAPTPVSRDNW